MTILPLVVQQDATAAAGDYLHVASAVCDRLRQICTMPLPRDIPEILALLAKLENVPMSVTILKTTGLGLELKQRALRRHRDRRVRDAAEALLGKWRAFSRDLVDAGDDSPMSDAGLTTPTHLFLDTPLCDDSPLSAPPTPSARDDKLANADETASPDKEEELPAQKTPQPAAAMTMSAADFMKRSWIGMEVQAALKEKEKLKREKDAKKKAEKRAKESRSSSDKKSTARSSKGSEKDRSKDKVHKKTKKTEPSVSKRTSTGLLPPAVGA
eukprot:TRINITY_DN85353_c0_g1_i1.p1 TRINITY_DN85353_c0_g1~~TRINITY_DN85353_c0_g1_i1.p1  ORF type:complete len:270 (+),score=77.64 TRINITY_DN85353_c0_g1_i1:78-887(+)